MKRLGETLFSLLLVAGIIATQCGIAYTYQSPDHGSVWFTDTWLWDTINATCVWVFVAWLCRLVNLEPVHRAVGIGTSIFVVGLAVSFGCNALMSQDRPVLAVMAWIAFDGAAVAAFCFRDVLRIQFLPAHAV